MEEDQMDVEFVESRVHTNSTWARTRPTLSLYENKVWLKVTFIQTWPWPELDPRQVCMKIRFGWKSRSYKFDLGRAWTRPTSSLYENKV